MNKKQTEKLLNEAFRQGLDPNNKSDHYVEPKPKKRPKPKKS